MKREDGSYTNKCECCGKHTKTKTLHEQMVVSSGAFVSVRTQSIKLAGYYDINSQICDECFWK